MMILSVSKKFYTLPILIFKKKYKKNIRQKRNIILNTKIYMSQYINNSSPKLYPPSFQYNMQQNNYLVLTNQRNLPIRQSSLNRNSNTSSSMVLKTGKIQQNNGTKLRRQNSLKNNIQYKENDPYIKNSNIIHKIYPHHKQSTDYTSQYDAKNTYYNPVIVKRDKMVKDIGNQKPKNPVQCRQIINDLNKNTAHQKDITYRDQFYEISQKIVKMQGIMKDNSQKIIDQSSKIQKLEQYYQELSKNQINRKHSRSISTTSSSATNFKQLSDIMRLIEQTKNYQMKNSQEYRKKIQEFQTTMLQFRDQLNATAKKTDLEAQIVKVKQRIKSNSFSRNNLRNSSAQLHTHSSKQLKDKQFQSIENQIILLRSKIDKLDQSNTSIKADLVKSHLRQKLFLENIQLNIGQIEKKLQKINQDKSFLNQNSFKKGKQYEGKAISFTVTNELWHIKTQKVQQKRKQDQNYKLYSSKIDHNSSIRIHGQQQTNLQRVDPLMRLNQRIYHIDKQGYLLDKDNYYLLNDKNEQIRLSEKEIQVLKRLNVMV